VLDLEVLVGKLLTVNRLATSAVAAGEVTTLEHELRDDTVESRARVTETLLAGAESTEVFGSLWNYVVIENEVNATGLLSDGGGLLSILVEDRTFPSKIEVGLDGHICSSL